MGYSNSDCGGYVVDRRSTSNMIFSLSSGAISWQSKKQDIIALSTTEAEYVPVTVAAC